jgi:hypothetical protein
MKRQLSKIALLTAAVPAALGSQWEHDTSDYVATGSCTRATDSGAGGYQIAWGKAGVTSQSGTLEMSWAVFVDGTPTEDCGTQVVSTKLCQYSDLDSSNDHGCATTWVDVYGAYTHVDSYYIC